MDPIKIKREDVTEAIKKTQNWKSPGIDHIHNFWLKRFNKVHVKLAELLDQAITNPSTIPDFMTEGVTYLLPKSSPPSKDPSKYRPITFLLTSIISTKIYNHLEKFKIFSEEQKGCRKNSRGCKEQLAIDNAIKEEAEARKQDLNTAYIDYQKAFDSIPHSWLLEVLRIYKINPNIINMLEYIMRTWRTKINIDKEITGEVMIKTGIFQGDALSTLWFCLSLRPLTSLLKESGKGYIISNTLFLINHLFYMDDLKLIASTRIDLQKLLQISESFSHDIRMKFGLEKCRINAMHMGKWEDTQGYKMKYQTSQEIAAMEEDEVNKYLGFEQIQGLQRKVIKEEQLREKFRARLNKILRTKLPAKAITTAINIYAAPVSHTVLA